MVNFEKSIREKVQHQVISYTQYSTRHFFNRSRL